MGNCRSSMSKAEVERIKKLAEEGNAEAQDEARAVVWYRRAAEQAQAHLQQQKR